MKREEVRKNECWKGAVSFASDTGPAKYTSRSGGLKPEVTVLRVLFDVSCTATRYCDREQGIAANFRDRPSPVSFNRGGKFPSFQVSLRKS